MRGSLNHLHSAVLKIASGSICPVPSPLIRSSSACACSGVNPCPYFGSVMNVNFDSIIHLNETGAFLWREAEKGDFSVESLTAALLNEYEVDEATATRDVASFVAKLNEQKLAEE